jgi:cytochrome c-type biogenesis protein CcmE
MEQPVLQPKGGRAKFLVGGLLIIAAIIFLIVSSTRQGTQYYLTVNELKEQSSKYMGRDARISGVVLGDSIDYSSKDLTLKFTIAHITGDNKEIEANGGLAEVLHRASLDTSLERLDVVYYGVMPDLLKNEAQAIVTGKLGDDGVFHADELLLKCPSRYEETLPGQSAGL